MPRNDLRTAHSAWITGVDVSSDGTSRYDGLCRSRLCWSSRFIVFALGERKGVTVLALRAIRPEKKTEHWGKRSRAWYLTILVCCLMISSAGESSEREQSENIANGDVPKIEWIRSGVNTQDLVWGIRGHLLWGLAPPTGKPQDGPRGLIRLRYPVLPDGAYDLLNFIAVEPIVAGRKGFSELERSRLDDLPGKRFWVAAPDLTGEQAAKMLGGRLTRDDSDVETLTVEIQIEPFDNGAHVRLTVAQRSDVPDEIQLTIHQQPDSAPMTYCILTATMGNKARARRLWLDDRAVSSLELYPDYRESAFTRHRLFGLDQLYRNAAGDVLAAITTDEREPSAVEPFPRRTHWYYGGFPVAQYWRKPAGTWRDDLHVAVNGRYTYWMSQRPIPGGISFENFDFRERFYDGQRFHFGILPDSDLSRPRIMTP
jgi:hypothetical protein